MATLATADIKASGINLADRTVLLHLSIGVIGNSRKVAPKDAEIEARDMVNLNKKLLDSPELESIRAYDGEFRRWIDSVCLPFEEKGIRILSLAAVDRVEKRIREFDANRSPMVDKFFRLYSQRMREARERLTSVTVGTRTVNLWRENDYLSEIEARQCFYVEWHYRSLGETPSTLAAISPELFEAERQKAQSRMDSAADEITAVMRATLADLVTHLRDKLTPGEDGKKKVLRDTAVTNLQEFLENFSLRNVTNDADLAKLAEDCKRMIDPFSDVDVLRNVASYRQQLASDLSAVKTQLDSLVAEKPSRKFRFED
jgi:hypothetical protein